MFYDDPRRQCVLAFFPPLGQRLGNMPERRIVDKTQIVALVAIQGRSGASPPYGVVKLPSVFLAVCHLL